MRRQATKIVDFLGRHGEMRIAKGSVGACGNLFLLLVEGKGCTRARGSFFSLRSEEKGASRTRRSPATAFPTCQTKENAS